MAYNKTIWENLPSTNTPLNETNLNNIENGIEANEDELEELDNNKISTKNQITYANWQNVILTRSDATYINVILYGSNLLKEGTYSIANDFKLYCIGTTEATITIPRTAISEILRYDWGFELLVQRSLIPDAPTDGFNGVAIAHDGPLVLQST